MTCILSTFFCRSSRTRCVIALCAVFSFSASAQLWDYTVGYYAVSNNGPGVYAGYYSCVSVDTNLNTAVWESNVYSYSTIVTPCFSPVSSTCPIVTRFDSNIQATFVSWGAFQGLYGAENNLLGSSVTPSSPVAGSSSNTYYLGVLVFVSGWLVGWLFWRGSR